MIGVILYAALLLQLTAAVNVTVDLGYARYRGKSIGNGINRWAGMRYARSVSRVDGLRFTAPQEPLAELNKVTTDASKFGPLCIGSESDLKAEFGSKWSEDCLFVNVFAPSAATNTSKLPVYVFIQGGGFNVNGNANYDGADLIEAARGDMVVVNFNYRVGPYGFLASKEVEANRTLSLNNGLKDQRLLLAWVQKYIHEFGGDADHVTLGGASAGGGSVVLQLTAFGGRNDNLFHAAAAESAAFPPLRDVEQSQWQYDALLARSGCKDIACLSSLDAVTFQAAVRSLKLPFPGGKNPPIYFWNPTLDYDFIQNYTYSELKNDRYVKLPTIFGDSTNEGINFTPKTISNYDRARQFIVDQFPAADWAKIRTVWNSPMNAPADARWRALASDVYGHIRYNCPNLNMSAVYAENNTYPTYQYRWNVGGAAHVGELPSIWGNGTTASAVFMQAYWASFIRSYDPNKYTAEFLVSKGHEIDNPEWTTFANQTGGLGNRLRFGDDNIVVMEQVGNTEWERCKVISNMGLHLKQPTSDGLRVLPLTSGLYMTIGIILLQWFCP
ncbi:triacylglycerol lipase-like protein [Boeremia exigua]|uniref:triacylglycerol lipase-like protein n=1 Tax=Boeremia exigua TaxID=749465 RepID=UPI001E8D67BE|nr:triacylglycerol lipase-like protein [Boeremia exigua]KAH6618957.1 triacylglycerol lipase-like protein [Boeremia exigua]